MMLDKKAIDMLLTLDDQHLAVIIKKIAGDAGIPADSINIGPAELKGLRAALGMATDGDISRATELIQNYKNGKKGF